MVDAVAAPPPVRPPGSVPPRAPPVSFGAVLSALNPLQYVPVVGTIYRAVTGDTIPEGVRLVGSLVLGGLVGGPVSLVTGIAALVAEKATGVDPEAIAHDVVAALVPRASTPAAPDQGAPPAPAVPAAQAGAGDTESLNTAELARIRQIRQAYEAAMAANAPLFRPG